MNQFSLNLPSSETLWYTPTSMDPHSQKSLPFFYHPSSLSLSNKYDDVESDNSTTASNAAPPQCEATSSSISVDHEYMFEKPLTPSDVGKLNRLVIPKQHAEKYFPLSASSTTSTATDASAGVGGGGVLLGFEDESGKCWKFRYSYWNSSQSYVLTKGWSRYVKEKKLDAGDVVLFQRHRFDPKRFFIGWRRRGSAPAQNNPVRTNPVHNYAYNNNNNGAPHHQQQIASFPSSYHQPDCLHSGTGEVRQKGRKGGSGNSRRLRLFGVNLECEIEEEDEEEMSQTTNSDGSSLSSQGQAHAQAQAQAQIQPSGFPMGPTTYNYFDYVGVAYPPNHNHYSRSHMVTMTTPPKTASQLIHDSSSIYFLHPSDGPQNPLTKYLLTGENYDVWQKAVINALEGKNKLGFVNDEYPRPTSETSPESTAWRANNSTICSWIFNSVDPTIQPSIVTHKIASELWLDLKERYSVRNGPRINQLKSEYQSLRQKGMSVVTYYNKFKALWDELYGSVDVTCGCTCAAAPKIKARTESEKTHDFVLGLDDDQYAALRTQLLSMEPFPSLNKAFALATQEERHKSIVRGRDDKSEIVSFAALSSNTGQTRPASSSTTPAPITCTYCGRTGHDYEVCYRRVGFPPGMTRGRGRGRNTSSRGRGAHSYGRGHSAPATANAAHVASDGETPNPTASTSSIPGLTSDQVQRLLTMLDTNTPAPSLTGPHFEDADWTG